jgi:hypothetical protein
MEGYFMNKGLKRAVYSVLDERKEKEMIGGWELTMQVQRVAGQKVYPNVVLKIAKWWAYLSGGMFECKDFKRSVYQFEPGARKIFGTYYETLPVQAKAREYRNALRKAGRLSLDKLAK